ncbi:hypothetical protein BRC65_03535 [Halobacteriales archaeon QH_2_65_14]|nr:MAG: hypothetical protein BRC65_03535 [Halobacteriales archaeon QH_2_65_14]
MVESDTEPDEAGEGGEHSDDSTVERAFTCTFCGFPMTHEAAPLQAEVSSICHNCGDWTVQSADRGELFDAVHDAAGDLAGEVLTERQARAYLLREVLGSDRETAAEAMDSTASNVDNLHQRAKEKIDDARRVIDELDRLQPDE